MCEAYTEVDNSLRELHYKDYKIMSHNCFLEEQIEVEFENYLDSPCASYLKYAFPLIKKIYEKYYNNITYYNSVIHFESIDDRKQVIS